MEVGRGLTSSEGRAEQLGEFELFVCNDRTPTELYTLSLHDALPISTRRWSRSRFKASINAWVCISRLRSEEHTSELQSPMYLVCRLLLEKKKKPIKKIICNILYTYLISKNVDEMTHRDNMFLTVSDR